MQSYNTKLPDHIRVWLNKRGISNETIALFNIGYTTSHPHLPLGAIVIPVNHPDGTHFFNKYRRDPNDDKKPKYLYDTGGRTSLFGAELLLGRPEVREKVKQIAKDTNSDTNYLLELNARDSIKTVVITEGELDTLVLHSLNIPAVSSTGGAQSFQEEFIELLRTNNVYVCYDNDRPGAQGVLKTHRLLAAKGIIPKVIEIPFQLGVKDISDFVSRGGDFHELMKTAQTFDDITEIEADLKKRSARWQTHNPIHEVFLEEERRLQEHHNTVSKNPKYEGSDEVLKAKAVPMSQLLDIPRDRKIKCLWHNEKTPSLHYFPKTNNFYCFGSCGRHYDTIDVYMHQHGVSFLEAVEELNKTS